MSTVLLVTWDGAGSYIPQRTLVRALVERGHSVHVLGHDTLAASVAKDGACFVPLRHAKQYDSTEEIPPEREMPLVLEIIWLAKEWAVDTSEAIDRLKPDVVLVDAAIAYGLVAALGSGVPIVVLWATFYALLCGGPFKEMLDTRLGEINAFAASLGLGPFSCHQALLESSSRVLVSSYRDFDLVPDAARRVIHVGPLRVGAAETTPRWQRRRPDKPLVLVGLSTGYQAQAELLSKLAAALGEIDVEALITSGPAVAPESIAHGANTSVLRFVSHDSVLPETDLLVTHAGHGTVTAGLMHGVPLVCIPMGRDQPMVAGRVAELGLGRVLAPDASVAEIRRAVTSALGDVGLRKTAAAFAASMAGHPGVAEAVAAIEEVLR